MPLTRAPSVAVVVPTHNRQALLADAVHSSLAQTWGSLDVIIIDDGSSDGTADFVAGLLRRSWPHDRVRYLRQENQGASAARNHGLAVARGEYVQFLDSDDVLDPNKLAKQIAVLETPENRRAACCVSYGRLVTLVDGETVGAGARIGVCASSPSELLRELCSRRVHGMQTSAPLWRREFLVERGGWREDIGLGDDLEYYVRLLVDAQAVCFVDEVLFTVREHAGSRLSADRMNERSLESLIKTQRSVFESVQRAGLWDAETQAAFLGAMRTVYANALALGNTRTIQELEEWLWELASKPRHKHAFRSLIRARRLFGRKALLGAHDLFRQIRLR